MSNRINELIKKGIENHIEFEKELMVLEKEIKVNPNEKSNF